MKLSYVLPLLLIGIVPMAFADTPLESQTLEAKSAIIDLEIKFGEDNVKVFPSGKERVTPTLEKVSLYFYEDLIDLTNSDVRMTKSGEHFRISNAVEGIIMYGHYNKDLENYKINMYFSSSNGMIKYSVNTPAELPDDKVIEKEPEEVKAPYVPDLKITSSHDFKTYWKDTFDISVISFDGVLNRDPKETDFDGRIDGANVTVILSKDGEPITSISGTTENNGLWAGQFYVQENIIAPGEYVVDVIATYLDIGVSETSTMFIVGTVPDGGGITNIPPVANAGVDQNVVHIATVNLDGSASTDSDGSIVSYSWIQTGGPAVTLNNANTSTPDFDTVGASDTYTFDLTVTDNRGGIGTDTVQVTT